MHGAAPLYVIQVCPERVYSLTTSLWCFHSIRWCHTSGVFAFPGHMQWWWIERLSENTTVCAWDRGAQGKQRGEIHQCLVRVWLSSDQASALGLFGLEFTFSPIPTSHRPARIRSPPELPAAMVDTTALCTPSISPRRVPPAFLHTPTNVPSSHGAPASHLIRSSLSGFLFFVLITLGSSAQKILGFFSSNRPGFGWRMVSKVGSLVVELKLKDRNRVMGSIILYWWCRAVIWQCHQGPWNWAWVTIQ